MNGEKFFPKPVLAKAGDQGTGKESFPCVDKETGIYTDKDGRQWTTRSQIAVFLNRDRRFVSEFVNTHSISSIRGKNRINADSDLFPLDGFVEEKERRSQIPSAENTNGIYTDESGKKWAPIQVIADQTEDFSRELIESYTQRFSSPYKTVIALNGKETPFFELDETLEKIKNLPRCDPETNVYIDGSGKYWVNLSWLENSYKVKRQAILPLMNRSHSILGVVNVLSKSPEGERYLKVLTPLYPLADFKDLDKKDKTLLPVVDVATGFYIDKQGRKWSTKSRILRLLQFTGQSKKISKLFDSVESILGNDEGHERKLFLVSKFDALIEKRETLPKVDRTTGIYIDEQGTSWASTTTIADLYNVDESFILKRLVKKKNIFGLNRISGPSDLYAVEDFENEVKEHQGRTANSRKRDVAKRDIEIFFTQSQEVDTFNKLRGVLGAEAVRDLLFAMRPEFAKLPPREVHSRLATYLGEYTPPKPFPVSSIFEDIAPLLVDNIHLQELLLASIKREGQKAYFNARRASEAPDRAPLDAYFAELRSCVPESAPEIESVLSQVWDYFSNVMLGDLPSLESVAPFLKEGRPFPDIYQRINVHEIRNHQRFLIADEMGVGKSASAILAKESLGIKCALVVAPATVCSTWERYLSDKVSDDGKQIGYFKPGQAPRVLAINDSKDIERISEEEFDYVVISREKLNNFYMDELRDLSFDMLIVDEVHQYKRGEKGVFSENLLKLVQAIDTPEKRLVLLSGTPVPNKVRDVAMLLKLLHTEFQDRPLSEITRAVLGEGELAARVNLLPLMQMKNLADHVDMPDLAIEEVLVDMSPEEAEEYGYLLDTDDLEPQVKMQLLRRFLLNNRSVMDVSNRDLTTQLGSKETALKNEITEALESKNKIIVFVNDHIENVIRGEHSIIERLGLPADVDTFAIHGESENGMTGREETRRAFQESNRPSVLFLSGQTEHAGVDYSYADHVIFYNEPWTYAAFQQQLARVYRPGLKNNLTCRVLVTKGTIEEGIHEYVKFKHHAIEKLLRGAPLSDKERDALKQEDTMENLEVNPSIARQYFSSLGQLMRLFGRTKERGQADLLASLGNEGKEYADIYEMYGGRSYQDNGARMCANLIRTMAGEQGRTQPDVLDMGSGPAMIQRRAPELLQQHVVSLDLNRNHFEGKKLGQTIVGSMTNTPFPSDASELFDYVTISLAIQDTAYRPNDGEYERIHAFAESARMLRPQGRLLINMQHSLDFRDEGALSTALEKLGLRAVPEYTGEVTAGEGFKSRVLVFEKTRNVEGSIEDIIESLSPEEIKGFYFLNKEKQKARARSRGYLKQRDRIIFEFSLNDKTISIDFNEDDGRIRGAEKQIIDEVEEMKKQYSPRKGRIRDIPPEALLAKGYSRLTDGKGGKRTVRLFKKVPGDGGITFR